MKTKEKINFDKLIKEAILNGKHVWIERHDDIIVNVDSFDTKEEMIKISKNYFHADICFLTAEEVFIRECNSNYYEYLDGLAEDSQDDNEFVTRENFRKNIISYDEYNKDIDKDDFVDGFYEWTTLFGEVKFPNPTTFSYICGFGNDKEGIVKIEIF